MKRPAMCDLIRREHGCLGSTYNIGIGMEY